MFSKDSLLSQLSPYSGLGFHASIICGGCGSHSGLRPLPIGINLAVMKTPIEAGVEHHEKWPRYTIKRETFPLPDGWHANMRLLKVKDYSAATVYGCYEEETCPDNECTYKWKQQAALWPCLWQTVEANWKWGHFNYNTNSRTPTGDGYIENMRPALQNHIKGQHMFFVIKLREREQFREFWTKCGCTVVYETDSYNNRAHEHVPTSIPDPGDYLCSLIVKV